MTRQTAAGVQVRGDMVYVDGVKVGRVSQRDGKACIQFWDRDRRRAAARGSREVCVPIDQLAEAVREHTRGKVKDGK